LKSHGTQDHLLEVGDTTEEADQEVATVTRTLEDANEIMRSAQMVINMYRGLQDGYKYVFRNGEVELQLVPIFDAALPRYATILTPCARGFQSILDVVLTTLSDRERSTNIVFSNVKRLVLQCLPTQHEISKGCLNEVVFPEKQPR
jgi:hypothetical protein